MMGLRQTTLSILLLACAGWAGNAAMAQDAPVYRCGNSYSSQPCTGGALVDAVDPRSAAQRQQAEAARQRDAKLARQMATDRRAAEREAARSGGPANVGPHAAGVPAKAASATSAAGKHRHKPKVLKVKKGAPADKHKPAAAKRP